MKVFITGTDTNVGKTMVSAWLCHHLQYAYWKPIQTGQILGTDRDYVAQFGIKTTYPERYCFDIPVSPHVAASSHDTEIALQHVVLPDSPNLIIEGAGGVLVPLGKDKLMIDLIKQFNVPVIIVARAGLGTINHSLLTIQALRNKHIPILGVILNNQLETDSVFENAQAIEVYGRVPVLACIPQVNELTPEKMKNISISPQLLAVFNDG